ncbi:MAG: dipeptidyl peptidase 3, partial [Muribaculaceae bacterium]|nr:dipeptidyl peptidase 3 [Muribaculaceae bacterium]
MNKLIIAATVMAASSPLFAQKASAAPEGFDYTVDRFADIEVLRYQVPDFENLSLNQKLFVYYLTEAALQGRDILFDQNGRYNLELRSLLEAIYKATPEAQRDSADFKAFEKYLKQVWFGNGVHHHYSMDKFTPEFSQQFFDAQVAALPEADKPADIATLRRLIFDPAFMSKRVNQADGVDLITTSACNLYGPGVTQAEVEDFYAKLKDPDDATPISYGLNSRLVKDADGSLREDVYKEGGLYSPAIEAIVANLKLAAQYAETPAQREVINSLITFYQTGDLKEFDRYSILWAEDTDPQVDFINGFIESYGDPLGMRGSWESIAVAYTPLRAHQTAI